MLRAIPMTLLLVLAAEPATAPVTVRFRNTNAHPVYVNVTWSDGVAWPFPVRTDTQPCSAGCNCFSIAHPPPTTRVLPPGGVVESSWDGHYVDVRSCEGPVPSGSCRCHTGKKAAPGRYTASFAGSRVLDAVLPAPTPEGDLIEGALPHESKGRCAAKVDFELGATPRTFEAAITCESDVQQRRLTPGPARPPGAPGRSPRR